jgi:hypothetical protein
MRLVLLLTTLLVLCAPLTGCQRHLDETDVREFIDEADNAARKRFAPEICELRAKDFTLHVKFQGYEPRLEPTEIDMDRALFCKQAGAFSRLRQYKLERKSIEVDVAADRKTARVTSNYIETLPYYEPGVPPRNPDDFSEFQVVDSHDESVVGIEGGDLVFLSTTSSASQELFRRDKLSIPFD